MIENMLPPEKPNGDLKTLRESKGLTLGDLFQITKISPISIGAIENGDFHLLPPPVYTKAFIKTYAQIIGVDSKKILDRYERYLETSKTTYEREATPKSLRTIGTHYRKLFLSLSSIIVAGVVIFCISLCYEDDIPCRKTGKAVPPASDTKPADTTNLQMQVKDKTADQASTERSYHLSIEATDLTWLRIREGQDPSYEVLLQPGEKIERIAPSFAIDVGNAGGIKVEFEGTPLASLGGSGQVVYLRLP